MANPLNYVGTERARRVQSLFTHIAKRYDLMNRIITFGQDVHWRKHVIQLAKLKPEARLLDLGTGTGDLTFEALRQIPSTRPVAVDFTLEMMRVGQQRGQSNWSAADALNLPFPDHTFDAVVSGFLMRNVTDVQQVLKEQYRTLKPGGRIVILDTTRPKKNLLSPFVHIHLHVIIPLLGRLIARAPEAYTYLPDSTEGFLRAEELAARMAAVSFKQVGFERLNFGTIAIHWAEK